MSSLNDIEDVLIFIREKWLELYNLIPLSFEDRTKIKSMGTYVIYDGTTPIYVGSTGRALKDRLDEITKIDNSKTEKAKQRDPFYHPLARKLTGKDIQKLPKVEKYLNEKCSVRFVGTERLDQAEMLEYVFIVILRPTYNKEQYKAAQKVKAQRR